MIEKITEVAGQAVDALKGSPVLLVLVLLQVVLLGAVLYASRENRKADTARFELVMKQCGPKGD